MNSQAKAPILECCIAGVGAWGPGFDTWPQLKTLLREGTGAEALANAAAPKPAIIPANERRRAPLAVKAAVEVSSQALAQSSLSPSGVACVFGSGLGDTDITDYMCRILASDNKQLSPTKFHNSVHNAAAGYWTISTACMKSANSVAAYKETAGLALLEGVTLCAIEQEPVLVTVFDCAAQETYKAIFGCPHSFAAAVVLTPCTGTSSALARLSLSLHNGQAPTPFWRIAQLQALHNENPAAQMLVLLDALQRLQTSPGLNEQALLRVSEDACVHLDLQAGG